MKRQSEQQRDKIPAFGLRDRIAYGIGDIGNDVTFVLVGTYFMVFATNVMGVKPGHVGTLLLVARLIDAFFDLAVGRIADVMPARRDGKFRPWVRWFGPIVPTLAVICFLPIGRSWSYGLRLSWLAFIYFAYGVCYSCINIAYGSLATLISSHPRERSELSVARSLGAMLGGVIVLAVLPLFIYTDPVSADPQLSPTNLMLATLACALIALGCYWGCHRWTIERVSTARSQHSSFLHLVAALATSRPLLSLIAVALASVLGLGVIQNMQPYLWLDYFRDPRLQSVAAVALFAPTLFVAPFATRLATRFGKKELTLAAMVVSVVTLFALAYARITNPFVFLGFALLIALGQGIFALLVWAFIADIIDNHELIRGDRDEATVYATYSWSRKLGQALAGGLSGWLLGWIGYQPSRNGEVVARSQDTINGLYAITTFVPGVLFLLLTLMLWLGYPLNRDRARANAEELASRRAHSSSRGIGDANC